MTASSEGGGEQDRLKEHPFVAALIPDPSAGPPDSTVLHGYVGKSTRAKHWRLYLDASLASYVELPEDDILHHSQVANDGGTLVWVPKSLELKVTRVSSTTMQAEFLSGAIAAGRMRPTRPANLASPAAALRSVGCPSILNNCTSQILPCPSDGCPTFDYCPPPPTETGWCRPSEFVPLCTLFGLELG
jgi:hypothetical protein